MAPVKPLRPYQEECVDLVYDRLCVLIAAVMGAGKTIMAIESIRELRQEEPALQAVVFCTSSLKFQWAEEIKEWDPGARVVVIDGAPNIRKRQYARIGDSEWTILTYDSLIHDWPLILKYLPNDALIADEVTMIKGPAAKRSKRLKSLARHAPIRLGLSGQPVENRPEELFSIMQFVDPSILGSHDLFDNTFIVRNHGGKVVRYRNLDTLHKIIGPAMFRRSRKDIEEYLPKKLTTHVVSRLDPKTQEVYNFIARDLMEELSLARKMFKGFNLNSHYGVGGDPAENAAKGRIMARVTCLRLLASHPNLLAWSADDFDDEETTTGSQYASGLKAGGVLDGMPKTSTKLETLLEIIETALAEDDDEKIVVFSSFRPMISIIGEELAKRKIGYTSITGETPSKVRKERMDRFNQRPNCRVFLSSDAGAYGINLTAGKRLINYDYPWSAGKLGQRIARIDRTSSQHDVIMIQNMFNAGTIDERQLNVLEHKLVVGEAFIDKLHFDTKGSLDIDLDSLTEFIAANLPIS